MEDIMLALNDTKADAREAMLTAMRAQDQEGFTKGLEAYGEALIAEMKEELESFNLSRDQRALAARGQKPLTSTELKFAKQFKNLAMARLDGKDVKAELGAMKMPETTIDLIFEDITIDHPLLNYVDFQNTSFAVKWLMSKNPYQKAFWGDFDAEVTKEVSASFSEKDMTKMSLTAFVPISRGLLDLGPDWIYRYIVAILKEAIANGLEDGIINNLKDSTGPIGMMADLTAGTTSDGVTTYTAKTKEVVEKLDPVTYGTLLAKLAKTPNGNPRPVNQVIMIVNPVDYLTRIFPAITVM
ncbi:MAG: phage major capsid protein, partial [Allobaculum sp.]|nr:phage major capsid protein [Allobaculum sp.]